MPIRPEPPKKAATRARDYRAGRASYLGRRFISQLTLIGICHEPSLMMCHYTGAEARAAIFRRLIGRWAMTAHFDIGWR